MEEHLQSIRAALAAPTEDVRRAGANACRTILQVLEGSQLASGGIVAPPLPPPLHVVPTTSVEPSVPEKGAEPLLAASLPQSGPQDMATVVVAGATKPAGSASELPTLPVLPGGVALGTLLGRGAGGAMDPAVVAAVVSAVKNLKPEQWVDLILSKLLTFLGTQGASPMALPAGGAPTAAVSTPVAQSPYHVQLVPARPGWVTPPSNRRR